MIVKTKVSSNAINMAKLTVHGLRLTYDLPGIMINFIDAIDWFGKCHYLTGWVVVWYEPGNSEQTFAVYYEGKELVEVTVRG